MKVSGVLGRAAPVEKKGPAVGDQVVGMGGTTQWKLASLVSLRRSSSVMLSCLQAFPCENHFLPTPSSPPVLAISFVV